MTQRPTILVFDSGFGGLTVLKEIVRARPDANYVYAADNAAFPYGNLSEPQLVSRVIELFERLMAEYLPDIAVVACNTASTVVLPHLRGNFSLPFVGTVPAIKPAATASKSRLITVLGTPGTVTREYTKDLIAQFAEGCDVTLVGAKLLAGLAERKLRGEEVSDQDILVEIKPAFVEKDGKRTDQIVLACRALSAVAGRISQACAWPVHFVDPAPAIAPARCRAHRPAKRRRGRQQDRGFHRPCACGSCRAQDAGAVRPQSILQHEQAVSRGFFGSCLIDAPVFFLYIH